MYICSSQGNQHLILDSTSLQIIDDVLIQFDRKDIRKYLKRNVEGQPKPKLELQMNSTYSEVCICNMFLMLILFCTKRIPCTTELFNCLYCRGTQAQRRKL